MGFSCSGIHVVPLLFLFFLGGRWSRQYSPIRIRKVREFEREMNSWIWCLWCFIKDQVLQGLHSSRLIVFQYWLMQRYVRHISFCALQSIITYGTVCAHACVFIVLNWSALHCKWFSRFVNKENVYLKMTEGFISFVKRNICHRLSRISWARNIVLSLFLHIFFWVLIFF